MTLQARELPLPPEPLSIARRLGDETELALLWTASGGRSFIAVRPLEHSHSLDPEPGSSPDAPAAAPTVSG